MLRVVTGPFHPELESALVEQIRHAKAADPFASVAILVPSWPLVDRLRRLLAVEHRLSLLNVHFLTFHQLALRLAREAGGEGRYGTPIDVVDALFFEQLVRHLVGRGLSSFEPFQRIGHSFVAWGALWATLRDLKDAGIDPDAALRAIDEGYFDSEDAPWLRALFSLHAAVKQSGRALAVGTPDDLAESLIPFVPESKFLRSLQQALYYGFYDLTQVQLSFFEAVAKTAPTTLFFPVGEEPAEAFARRFFDRYIQRLAPQPERVVRLSGATTGGSDGLPRTLDITVRTVFGAEEELASACRSILDLVDTNGYRFEEIGVVARTLDPYRAELGATFDRHRIPFTTSAGRPLIHEPLCKALLQLASLPLNEGYHTAVLDVVTSPLYRRTDQAGEKEAGAVERPDLWKLIVPALHITSGPEDWSRLERASRSVLTIERGEEEAASAGPLGIAPDITRRLWEVVSELLTECAAIPVRGTAAQMVEAFQGLIARRLHRRQESDAIETDGSAAHLELVWEGLDRVFASLGQLDAIGDDLTWADFVELLTHAVERVSIPLTVDSHKGVAVLDAMSARGLPFKALFILGLNEKMFPRFIGEDAFLRDRHRRVLAETLGFKIDEKLMGYDEEALLFSLLCRAAGRRLFLSFQRADEQGRSLAASAYVSEALRRFGMGDQSVDAIPRRLSDRLAQRPGLQAVLPPRDLALWAVMGGHGDPPAVLGAMGQEAAIYRTGVDTLARIEDEQHVLTPFDGATGPLDDHWDRMLVRGIAPTPLERYARCPFQYFAAEVLRLEPIRAPVSRNGDAVLNGTLCHAALRRCYEQLIQTGWPHEPLDHDRLITCVRTAVEQAAAECEGSHDTGHYLLWELAKDTIRKLVVAAVESDRHNYEEDGFAPVSFEVDVEGTLSLSADLPTLKIRGRLDRVDSQREMRRTRIVDYKFKAGSAMKSEDRRLLQSAVRGYRLQPPLYTLVTVPGHPPPDHVQLFFLAPNWPHPIARHSFPAGVWSSRESPRLRRTIRILLDGIQSGLYFMLPGGYCDTCDFRVACRRVHTPSWWRGSRTPEAEALTALRRERVLDE